MTEYRERRVRAGVLWRVVAGGHPARTRPASPAARPAHLVLPDAALDLMWHRGRLVVAGPDTVAQAGDPRPGEATWGLRLAPGAAHALLGVPARELADRRVDLADLVPAPPVPRGDPPAALEDAFAALWRAADPDPAPLRLAASLDRAAREARAVPGIAREHGMSERSLRRACDRLFGYGPKTLMSIHRLQRALRLARSGTPLGGAAATAGYADQAHFSREVSRLTGLPPGVLLDRAPG
ncbi:helix-turn-helix domain-containing protein [Nocardiopsis flavescens]|uniref:helix-turn-helix domain-containing protein n=1 Tax=Nocardiopsis flavescens TaxID=758803 RepID=UPI001C4A6012|nr:helix-turn-helix domain-containing protein [Nocardiopsis flavescens]